MRWFKKEFKNIKIIDIYKKIWQKRKKSYTISKSENQQKLNFIISIKFWEGMLNYSPEAWMNTFYLKDKIMRLLIQIYRKNLLCCIVMNLSILNKEYGWVRIVLMH